MVLVDPNLLADFASDPDFVVNVAVGLLLFGLVGVVVYFVGIISGWTK